jgi:hypothetical protein
VRKLTVLSMLTVLLLAMVDAGTHADGSTVSLADGRFSLAPPDGWREIPGQELEDLSVWIAEATFGRSVEVYQYGFVPGGFESDPWLPHMLVQIRDGGRLPYGLFLGIEGPTSPVLADEASLRRGLPPLILGVEIDRVSFDPSTFCLRIEHTMDLKFKGPARVQTAAFLTETGLIALHFIDRERRTEEARLTFDSVVSSVSIAPELRYRPRVLDRWPGLPFFVAAGLVAIGLAAYLLVRRSPR